MGYFLNLLATFITSISLHVVDPHDCMSKEEAELLKSKLETLTYVLDYCDCCQDVGGNVQKKVIKINSTKVVSCAYDNTRHSLEISGIEVNGTNSSYNGLAVLNYQFFYSNGTAIRLGNLLNANYNNVDCSGAEFPTEISDKAYQKWLKSK